MTFKYGERIQETTTSTGTGDLVLAGVADASFQAFSAFFSNGDTTDIAIFGGGQYEVCRATYNTGANSVTRGTVYASSNGGAAVNFSAGSKTVIVTGPGALIQKLVSGELSGQFVTSGVISPSQITSDQTDYNPASLSTSTVLRLNTDAARSIRSLAGGSAGRNLTIQNVGSFNITLLSEYTSGTTAGMRFSLASDAVIKPNGSVMLTYDGTSSRWRLNRNNNALEQGRRKIFIPSHIIDPRISNGPSVGFVEMATNKNNIMTIDFDWTNQEFAHFSYSFGNSWDKGTISFQPVWSHVTASTNFGIVWALQAVAVSDGDTLDVAYGTEQTSTDTGGTANVDYTGPESAAITVAGSPANGDTIMFQIKRNPTDGGDTIQVDGRLWGLWIYYNISSPTDV